MRAPRRVLALTLAAGITVTVGATGTNPAIAAGPATVTSADTSTGTSATPDTTLQQTVHVTTTDDIALDPPVETTRVAAAQSAAARLAGASRYETAVAISTRAYSTAPVVYLAGGTGYDEALAGAALTDGPVLLVPTTGAVPASVAGEIRRLGAREVIALGGASSVSAPVLAAAGAGRSTGRLGSNSIVDTATAISRRAFPAGAAAVYLARNGGSPDALAGGVLRDGPVLPVPATGPAPVAVRAEIARLSPHTVTALGGPAAVSDATLTSAAASGATTRIAGAHRYATAAAIARHAFPNGASIAYLASGTSFADALAGGTLGDGPVLLTPPPSAAALVEETARALTALRVTHVATLGGPVAVSEGAIREIVSKAPRVRIGPLPRYVPPRATPAPTPSNPTPTPSSPAPAPTATPSPTPPVPAPTPRPTQTPTTTPPSPTSTPSPTPTSTPSPTANLACEATVTTFRPIVLDTRYTIRCGTDVGGSDVLGITRTSVYVTTGELARGEIVIRSDLSGARLLAVIAHEIAHAWSYAYLTESQRSQFTAFVGGTTWGGGSYNDMPAEIWARTHATCAGYPDGFNRREVTCADLEPYGVRS